MRFAAGLCLSVAIVLAPGPVRAQDAWPARPVTFIVPYGAGGYTDLVARLSARYVEKAVGKPVIVDYRVGAGGIVGTQIVVNAAPDGYTFCVCSIGAISIAPFDPNQKVTYDPLRSSLLTSAKAAFDAGFLGRQMPDLSNLYDMSLLNQVLSEKGKKAIQ